MARYGVSAGLAVALLGAGMVVDLNRAVVVAVAVIGLVWLLIRKEPEIEAF